MNCDSRFPAKRLLKASPGLILLTLCIESWASPPVTAGWIEHAVLLPQQLVLHAKLDTGAKTSSIHAPDPAFFTRSGENWVRLTVTNRDNESATIETKVVRYAKIKRHFGESQARPVIMLDVCIGNVRKTEEVNLVDRGGLNYPLLIGRNFLEGSLLIDSGATYKLSPDCSD